jgi:quercetin dioxygenase-like cupin family protein
MPWSGATGAVITGELLHIAVLRYPRGAAVNVNSSLAERFAFVASGSLLGEVDGQAVTIGERSIVHVPSGIPHGFAASGDSDALVVIAQDNSYAFAA